MSDLLLIISYPPSANRLWRYVNGRAIKSAEYRRWLETAAWEVIAQRPTRIEGRYRLALFVRPPDRRRRDIDNLLKPSVDLLVRAGVISDDCNAQSVHAEWAGGPVPGGHVSILITPIAQELAA